MFVLVVETFEFTAVGHPKIIMLLIWRNCEIYDIQSIIHHFGQFVLRGAISYLLVSTYRVLPRPVRRASIGLKGT